MSHQTPHTEVWTETNVTYVTCSPDGECFLYIITETEQMVTVNVSMQNNRRTDEQKTLEMEIVVKGWA